MAVAREQHAMIQTAQLRACGFSRGQIEHRIRTGWLTPRHRGVFLVGPVMPPLGPEAAALLACPGAVLSHFSAGAVYGITQRPDSVHVITPTQRRKSPGLIPHRGTVDRSETRTRRNLSLTSPFRTLRDLQGHASEDAYRHAVWEASYQKLVTPEQARDLLGSEPPRARFRNERILEDLIRRAGLPPPETNVKIGRWEIDLYWPEHRLVVEVDEARAHGHALAHERDARKDADLKARGIDLVRVPEDQLAGEPLATLARIAVALAS